MHIPILLTGLVLLAACDETSQVATVPAVSPSSATVSPHASPPASVKTAPSAKVPMSEQHRTESDRSVNEAALGYWALSIEGRPTCHMALNRLPVDGGRGVYLEGCAKDLATITAWRGSGPAIELVDGGGEVVVRLTATTEGGWRGEDRQGRAVSLALSPMV